MVAYQIQGCSSIICSIKLNDLIRSRYFSYGRIASLYYWKVITAALIIMSLFMLGFKSVKYDEDIVKLWVKNTSRLSEEKEYFREATSEYEDLRQGSIISIIQESNKKEDLLTREFLLDHLQLLQKIFDMKISYKLQFYGIKDLCIQLKLPKLHYLPLDKKNMVENVLPCQVISPVTCFWESSKLAGFDHFFKSITVRWEKLDPYQFIRSVISHKATYHFLRSILVDSQAERGYLDKPCLNPRDPDCPDKYKQYSVKSVLSKSCTQLSKLLYNYPRNLLVSNVNQEALQTILLLRSPSDLHSRFRTYNTPHWSEKDTGEILHRWNMKLREVISSYNKHRQYLAGVRKSFRQQRTSRSSFYVFHNDFIEKALQQASSNNNAITKYVAGVCAIILFVGLTYLVSDNLIQSHCWLAIIGVLMVVMTIFGGLGLSAAIDIRFSILSSQVLPFFILGISAEELLILTPIYFSHLKKAADKKSSASFLPNVLYEAGCALAASFMIKVATISLCFLIQLPLIFGFLVQLGIVLVFKTVFLVLVYPCFLHLDLIRQAHNRVDLICCLVRRSKLPPDHNHQPQYLAPAPIILTTECKTSYITHETIVKQYCEIPPPQQPLSPPQPPSSSYKSPRIKIRNIKSTRTTPTITWKIRYKISRTVVQIIGLIPVQITIVVIILIIILFGIYSVININFGIINESLFFTGSNEQKYVAADSRYFRLNNFQIFVSDLDYLYNADLLIQMHRDLEDLGHKDNMRVTLSGNGVYWLESFRGWLAKLQRDFHDDLTQNSILTSGTWFHNASRNGLLALTLFVQDNGRIDYSQMMRRSRLFDGDDRINLPPGDLPLYLAAWRSDSIDFPTIPCVIDALPPALNLNEYLPNSVNNYPKPITIHATPTMSQSIHFSICNYYLTMRANQNDNNNKNTFPFVTVQSIRSLVDRYTQSGLASMPIGSLFELSEQFTNLRRDFSLAILGCSLVTMGIVTLVTSGNFVAGLLSGVIWLCGVMYSMACIYISRLLPFNSILAVTVLLINGMCLANSPILLIVDLSTNKSPHSSLYSASYKTGCIAHNEPGTDSNNNENTDNDAEAAVEDGDTSGDISVEDQLTLALMKYGRRDLYIAITALISFFILSINQISFFKYHFFLLPVISMSIVPFFYFFVVPSTMFYMLKPIPSTSSSVTQPPDSQSSTNIDSPSTSSTTSSVANTVDPHQPGADPQSLEQKKLSTIIEESSYCASSSSSSSSSKHSSSSSAKTMESSSSSSSSSLFRNEILHYKAPFTNITQETNIPSTNMDPFTGTTSSSSSSLSSNFNQCSNFIIQYTNTGHHNHHHYTSHYQQHPPSQHQFHTFKMPPSLQK